MTKSIAVCALLAASALFACDNLNDQPANPNNGPNNGADAGPAVDGSGNQPPANMAAVERACEAICQGDIDICQEPADIKAECLEDCKQEVSCGDAALTALATCGQKTTCDEFADCISASECFPVPPTPEPTPELSAAGTTLCSAVQTLCTPNEPADPECQAGCEFEFAECANNLPALNECAQKTTCDELDTCLLQLPCGLGEEPPPGGNAR